SEPSHRLLHSHRPQRIDLGREDDAPAQSPPEALEHPTQRPRRPRTRPRPQSLRHPRNRSHRHPILPIHLTPLSFLRFLPFDRLFALKNQGVRRALGPQLLALKFRLRALSPDLTKIYRQKLVGSYKLNLG